MNFGLKFNNEDLPNQIKILLKPITKEMIENETGKFDYVIKIQTNWYKLSITSRDLNLKVDNLIQINCTKSIYSSSYSTIKIEQLSPDFGMMTLFKNHGFYYIQIIENIDSNISDIGVMIKPKLNKVWGIIEELIYKLDPNADELHVNNIRSLCELIIKRNCHLNDELKFNSEDLKNLLFNSCPTKRMDLMLFELIIQFTCSKQINMIDDAMDKKEFLFYSIKMFEVLKLILHEFRGSPMLKNHQMTIQSFNLSFIDLSNLPKIIIPKRENENNLINDSLSLICNFNQINEIVSSINRIKQNCCCESVAHIEIIKCKLTPKQSEKIRLIDGDLSLKVNDNWITPVFQPLIVQMINNELCTEETHIKWIDKFIEAILGNNLIQHCENELEFLMYLSASDYLKFNSNLKKDLKSFVNDLINEFEDQITLNLQQEFKSDQIKMEKIINDLIKQISKSFDEKELKIKITISFIDCIVESNEKDWSSSLIQIGNEFSGKLCTICHKDTTFKCQIKLDDFKKQISKCLSIGSNPSGIKRQSKKKIATKSTIKVLDDDRFQMINDQFNNWKLKSKEIPWLPELKNYIQYDNYRNILVENSYSIPNHIFVRESIKCCDLINEYCKSDIKPYNIRVTSTIVKSLDVINFDYVNHMNELMNKLNEGYWYLFYSPQNSKAVLIELSELKEDSNEVYKLSTYANAFKIINSSKLQLTESVELSNEIDFSVNNKDFRLRFMFNSDFKPIRQFASKSLVDYFIINRNGGEIYKTIKTKEGGSTKITYEQCNLTKVQTKDGIIKFYDNDEQIIPYECNGDLVEVNWYEELLKFKEESNFGKLFIAKLLFALNQVKNKHVLNENFHDWEIDFDCLIPVLYLKDERSFYEMNYKWLLIDKSDPFAKNDVFIESDAVISLSSDHIFVKTKNELFKCDEINIDGHKLKFKDVKQKMMKEMKLNACSEQLLKFDKMKFDEIIEYGSLIELNKTTYKRKFVQIQCARFKGKKINNTIITINNKNEFTNSPCLMINNSNLCIGRVWSSGDYIEIKSDQPIKWEVQNGRLKLPKELIENFPSFDWFNTNQTKDWFLKLHSIVENLCQCLFIEMNHKCDIEFTTSFGNERDILIDDEIIVEIKTQTLMQRALHSFLNEGKHTNEYLIATTRHSMFISKGLIEKIFNINIKDKLEPNEPIKKLFVISNLVSGFHNLKDSNEQILKNLFETSNFPININNVRKGDSTIITDNLIKLNENAETDYCDKLHCKFDESQFVKNKKQMNDESNSNFAKLVGTNQDELKLKATRQIELLESKQIEVANEMEIMKNEHDIKISEFIDEEEFMDLDEYEQLDYIQRIENQLDSDYVENYDNRQGELNALIDSLSVQINELKIQIESTKRELNEIKFKNEGKELNLGVLNMLSSESNLPRPKEIKVNVNESINLNNQLNEQMKFEMGFNSNKKRQKVRLVHGKPKMNRSDFDYKVQDLISTIIKSHNFIQGFKFEPNYKNVIHCPFNNCKFSIKLGTNKRTMLCWNNEMRASVEYNLPDEKKIKTTWLQHYDALSSLDVILMMIMSESINKHRLRRSFSFCSLSSLTTKDIKEIVEGIWDKCNSIPKMLKESGLQYLSAPMFKGDKMIISSCDSEFKKETLQMSMEIVKCLKKENDKLMIEIQKLLLTCIFRDFDNLSLHKNKRLKVLQKMVKHMVIECNPESFKSIPKDMCYIESELKLRDADVGVEFAGRFNHENYNDLMNLPSQLTETNRVLAESYNGFN